MADEITYLVQGSSDEPYIVKFFSTPFSISCTCTAAENGLPCKHRKTILYGTDPGIIKGDKSRLGEIAAAAESSGVFGLLQAYDDAKAGEVIVNKKADGAFKKYRDARLDLIMARVKTDRAVVKAREGMEAAIEAITPAHKAAITALAALRGVFIRAGE